MGLVSIIAEVIGCIPSTALSPKYAIWTEEIIAIVERELFTKRERLAMTRPVAVIAVATLTAFSWS